MLRNRIPLVGIQLCLLIVLYDVLRLILKETWMYWEDGSFLDCKRKIPVVLLLCSWNVC